MSSRSVVSAAVIFALCSTVGLVGSGEAGAVPWTSAGALPAGTYDGTATALPNGAVLFAGGRGAQSTPSAAAAVFDPALGTWAAAPSMHAAHAGHTATLIDGGRGVLVAGGDSADALGIAVRTAAYELYDVPSGTWTAAGTMTTPRWGHTATVLQDGDVLVAGGDGDDANPLAGAERYDVATDHWSAVASMATPRQGHTATRISGGRVLVAGGFDGGAAVSSAEIYDPATDAWTSAAGMSARRLDAAASLLPGGRVLVAGGDDGSGIAEAKPEIYDPAQDKWSSAAAMNDARERFTAVPLQSGKVLVAGGHDSSGFFPDLTLGSAELYDPGADAWSSAGTLLDGRARNAMAVLDDGRALMVGGIGLFTAPAARTVGLPRAELYTPPTTVAGAPIAFGAQRVGTTSEAAAVTITNTGTERLFVSQAALAGANAADFALAGADTCTDKVVAPQDSCKIDVVFSPALDQGRSASLSLSDNSATGTTRVALTGTGTAPRVRAESLRFGDQTAGTQSAAEPVTITNTGTADLVVRDVSIAGAHFLLAGDDTCSGATVAAGSSCRVGVRFAPQNAGAKQATISLLANTIDPSTKVLVDGTGMTAVTTTVTVPSLSPRGPAESFRPACKVVRTRGRHVVRCVVTYTGSRKAFGIGARLWRKGVVFARTRTIVRGKRIVVRLTPARRLRNGRYVVVLVVANRRQHVKQAVRVR